MLKINHKKNGAPIALVIKPTGNSAGLIIILEIKSAKTIKNAPKIIDPCSKYL